jgi:DNA modification methylase
VATPGFFVCTRRGISAGINSEKASIFMKSVHPFPARMAPEILDDILETCPQNAVILDPMCGSGTVLRKAIASGRTAIGVDSDPLAILMSSVATKKLNLKKVEHQLEILLKYVRQYRNRLSANQGCSETERFKEFWFADEQRLDLNAISRAIELSKSRKRPKAVLDLFRLALSRTIITKNKGASLAADVSHSRPHRVRTVNDFDVVKNFERHCKSILVAVNASEIHAGAKVRLDDARQLRSIRKSSVDAIITSPPYLNALDYLRGHKLSLVWLGKTIPELRRLRSSNVGAESAPDAKLVSSLTWDTVLVEFPKLSSLSQRQQKMTHRYMLDLLLMCKQFSRVLKQGAHLHTVIGNSNLGNVYVPNSDLFEFCGKQFGFRLNKFSTREIPENRRYLPISGNVGVLAKRMREEVIQTYVLQKL